MSWYYKREDTVKIYTVVYKFIRCFFNSKHPTTTCWLLEILHILSIKFSPKQAYSIEKKLKRDFQEVLTHLLQNSAAIVTDLFNITYENSYNLKLVMPPSVYEYICAWESHIQRSGSRRNFAPDFVAGPFEEEKSLSGPHPKHGSHQLSAHRSDRRLSRPSTFTAGIEERVLEEDELATQGDSEKTYEIVQKIVQFVDAEDQVMVPPSLLETFFKFYVLQTLRSALFSTLQNVLLPTALDKITTALQTPL